MQMYNVSWNSFFEHLASYQRLLFEEGMFADVTLITDDKMTFKAHKTVLSGASDMFRELLSLDTAAQPMLFIRGVSHNEMEALLKFIYLGECQLPENQLDHFTQTGLELGVRELIHIGVKNEEGPVKAKPTNTRNIIKKINISSELFNKVDIVQENNKDIGNSRTDLELFFPEFTNRSEKRISRKHKHPINKTTIRQ